MTNSSDGYAIVLKDLNDQRQALKAECVRLERECAEIDQLIEGIRKRLPVVEVARRERTYVLSPEVLQDVAFGTPTTTPPVAGTLTTTPLLAGMSMRWGILTVLGADGVWLMPAANVVELLRKGGLQAKEDKLKSNVSAVLSRMVANGELTNSGSSYEITKRGRDALALIHVGTKATFQNLTALYEEDRPAEKH